MTVDSYQATEDAIERVLVIQERVNAGEITDDEELSEWLAMDRDAVNRALALPLTYEGARLKARAIALAYSSDLDDLNDQAAPLEQMLLQIVRTLAEAPKIQPVQEGF